MISSTFKDIITGLAFTLCTGVVYADTQTHTKGNSLAGQWKTFDDKTHQPVSIVKLWEENGEWQGRIERILITKNRQDICTACKGEKKNKPIEGMNIIWGIKPAKDSKNNKFENGHILDPGNGKIYSASMTLLEHGRKLDVRGFIGISLIGRSQIWKRL